MAHGSPLARVRAGVVLSLVCVLLAMVPAACGTSSATRDRHDVEWLAGADANTATRTGIEQLLSEPWPDAIEVRSQSADTDQPPVLLASCRDYLDVADLEVRPFAGGGGMFAIFQAHALECQALALTRDARPAAVSHLRTLAFDETLPDHVPWQVAMIVSSAEAGRIAAARPRASWRQVLFDPLTEVSSCGPHCGHYGDPVQEQWVSLVARGDFDGDGIEDLLLRSSDAAKGGSYRAVRMLLVTRREPGGRVEVIRELEY